MQNWAKRLIDEDDDDARVTECHSWHLYVQMVSAWMDHPVPLTVLSGLKCQNPWLTVTPGHMHTLISSSHGCWTTTSTMMEIAVTNSQIKALYNPLDKRFDILKHFN
ncbi:hypothetical protein IRJ41_022515 [Triplophysa rosa]|uniref:Uncharacterized protein n=1 Tax=Triplophysa rosa TaxID=992332 RepID=A0A9W7X243_TRIRA|nr:hypothetical protein IRJ41_022515 [Triplophysa rosa]